MADQSSIAAPSAVTALHAASCIIFGLSLELVYKIGVSSHIPTSARGEWLVLIHPRAIPISFIVFLVIVVPRSFPLLPSDNLFFSGHILRFLFVGEWL